MIQELGAEEVRAAVRDVLADPAFDPPGRSLLDRALAWVGDLLQSAWEWLFPEGVPAGERWVAWLVVGAGTVALATVVIRFVRARRRDGRDGIRRTSRARADRPRSAAEWLQRARERAAEGALREAATAVYRGVLVHLEGQGLLRVQDWKTPGDYAMEVQAAEGPWPAFRDFLGDFLRVAFGSRPPGPDDVRRLEDRARTAGLAP